MTTNHTGREYTATIQGNKSDFHIGIDSGTNTGIAIWNSNNKCFVCIETLKIHEAMQMVVDHSQLHNVSVRVEDARLRKWFGKSGREQLQGAGSIKRDAVIWEDFLKDLGIKYEMVAPKNNTTKLTSEQFKRLSKWDKRTSEHSRDAAMLVIGR